jgi:hypothetical protein
MACSIFAVPILPWSAPPHGRLQIDGAQSAQQPDDAVATEVGRVRQRRPPVAVLPDQRLLPDQRRIPRHKLAHRLEVITPDRVHQLHRLHQARPARGLVTARQGELRVGQLRLRRVQRPGMVLPQLGNRGRIAGADSAKKLPGLMLELIQVRTDGQPPGGMTSLLVKPGVRWRRARRLNGTQPQCSTAQVDSVLSADGRRPARQPRQ